MAVIGWIVFSRVFSFATRGYQKMDFALWKIYIQPIEKNMVKEPINCSLPLN
jgi:hypothetical protein